MFLAIYLVVAALLVLVVLAVDAILRRRRRSHLDQLTEARILAEVRQRAITMQTMAAMREAAREYYGRPR